MQTPTRTAQVDLRLLNSSGAVAFEKTWKVRTPIEIQKLALCHNLPPRAPPDNYALASLMSRQAVGGLGSPKESKVSVTIELLADSAPAQLEITVGTTVLLGRLKYKGTVLRQRPAAGGAPSHKRSPSGRCGAAHVRAADRRRAHRRTHTAIDPT